jgi:uncharacterized repeat protein (TIGR01451 family)
MLAISGIPTSRKKRSRHRGYRIDSAMCRIRPLRLYKSLRAIRFLTFSAILALATSALAQQFSVSPSSVNVDPQGVTGSQIQVTADNSVAWTATSDQPWLTITSGNAGQGNGTIVFNVNPTPTANSRMATITVTSSQGTISVPVNQSAGILVVSPSSANVPAAGGSGSETVTSNSTALPWTVTSDQPWVTITGPSSRTGSGTVQWTAAANPTDSARSANIAITPTEGSPQTIPINQQAGPVGNTDLTISKTHSGTFQQGGAGTFSIAVSNPGSVPSSGAVTVTDTIPAGLSATAATGAGWTCTVGATVSCARSDTLAAAATYPAITLTVNVAANAPASVTNTAMVSGGGDTNPANNSASDTVTVTTVPPDLSIAKSHTGNFTAGQTGTFTITVSNAATAGPTSGMVTVSDTLPTGLTATAVTGTGWACAVGATVSCTRNDALAAGASYPAITLTANVASNAPASVTNTSMVSGGGDTNPANNSASDTVTVTTVPPDLSINKSHTGNFNAGQTGAFTINVFNAATAGPTSGTVSVSDTLPIGLTAAAATGSGWTCTVGATVTCTRNDVLAGGASYPSITLTVNIAINAPALITNTAMVSGGGDVTPNNNIAFDRISISVASPADLSITKSHTGSFAAGQSGTFTITVSNDASAGPTSGMVTVSDPLPTGFTATAASGTGWTCTVGPTVSCTRSDALAVGASYPAITLAVNVAANTPATVTNTAMVSGGGDVTPANDSASDTVTIVPAPPDLSITKSHTGNFTAGQSGTFTITVSNTATAGPTSGMVTVSDPLPTGFTATAASGTGWICTVGATVSCTRSDALAVGASYPAITLAVNVAANTPASVTNTAMVSGGGDMTPANNSASDTVTIVPAPPDLSITKSHTGNFTTGQTGAFTITVSNAAKAGPTSGTVTVSDTLPTGLTATAATGTGWTCGVVATLNCARNDALAAGASYPPITVTVAVATNAPPSVTNTAAVSGGGDTNVGNNTASDTVVISTVPPKLSITKSHAGPFAAGQTGVYTIVASNAQAAPTSGPVTVSDVVPDALTATAATGAGWTCTLGSTVTCTRSDTLAAGASYPPISLTVNVAPSAPAGVVNVAAVGGGVGSGGIGGILQVAADPTAIIAAADLSITKSHTGNFTAGQSGAYTMVVSNSISAGATTGIVTVSDALPMGLTATAASGSGWTCTVGSTVSCTRTDALAAGASYPAITLTANVAANAAASVTNTVSVAGGGDGTPANNSASDTVAIAAAPADLSIAKSHTGNFTAGQTGVFTITVSNAAAAGPTSGTVTVADPMPTGLTAATATGAGWTCTIGATVNCTRSDALTAGTSYPAITLTTNVTANAPASVKNTATVSGGGDATPANDSATDTATVNTVPPDLSLVKVHSGGFIPGQTGAYILSVSNAATAGPSRGAVTVSDNLPTGLTATAATGGGWTCTVGNTVTCTRSDALAPGSSYPPITITVNVAANAPPTVTNTATVTGGGDVTPANNSASDTTSIPANPPDLSIVKSHTGGFTAGKTGS